MKRPSEDIIDDLRDVEIALSPENLCCDGEASQSQMRTKFRKLTAKKSKLVKELGREATFDELWGRWMRKKS